jgi:hypothetical protein
MEKQKKFPFKELMLVLILAWISAVVITANIIGCDLYGASDFLLRPWRYKKTTEEILTPYGDTFFYVQRTLPSHTSSLGYATTRIEFLYRGKSFFQSNNAPDNTTIEPISNDDKGTVYAIAIYGTKTYFIRKPGTDIFELLKREAKDSYGRWIPYG